MEHIHFSQKIIYINAYCMLFMAILQLGMTIEMRYSHGDIYLGKFHHDLTVLPHYNHI